MYLPYQIDWKKHGYFTPSLYGSPLPDLPEMHDEWRALQQYFAAARAGDFERLRGLVDMARMTDDGLMRKYFLLLLADAGRPDILRELADDALDSSDPQYPADVAMTLASTGLLNFIPDVLELFARRVDDEFGVVLPIQLSTRLEPTWGIVADCSRDDDDGQIYIAKIKPFVEKLVARIGRADAPVLHGELFGVRRLAELYIEVLGDRSRMPRWQDFRRFFEAATGIDMSDCFENRDLKPLATAAKLETFLHSPEASRYEHGARYFWGHRIPDR